MKSRRKQTAAEVRAKLFVSEYLIDLNGAAAAVRAGYSPKGAGVQAVRLLARPEVMAAVQRAQTAKAKVSGVTADMVRAEMAKMAFANIMDFVTVQGDGSAVVNLSAMTRDQAAALTEIQVDEYVQGKGKDARPVKRIRIKMADKRAALMDLAKLHGFAEAPADSPDAKIDIEKRARVRAEFLAYLQDMARPEPLMIEGRAEEQSVPAQRVKEQ